MITYSKALDALTQSMFFELTSCRLDNPFHPTAPPLEKETDMTDETNKMNTLIAAC
jgi:hypothetical protein